MLGNRIPYHFYLSLFSRLSGSVQTWVTAPHHLWWRWIKRFSVSSLSLPFISLLFNTLTSSLACFPLFMYLKFLLKIFVQSCTLHSPIISSVSRNFPSRKFGLNRNLLSMMTTEILYCYSTLFLRCLPNFSVQGKITLRILIKRGTAFPQFYIIGRLVFLPTVVTAVELSVQEWGICDISEGFIHICVWLSLLLQVSYLDFKVCSVWLPRLGQWQLSTFSSLSSFKGWNRSREAGASC